MTVRARTALHLFFAVGAGILAVMSLVWPTWWEALLESSPDQGSGTWERLLAVVWLGAALAFGRSAVHDLRAAPDAPGR